ncbi:hypothetical protein AAC03nite_38500 [Alicyclobacillus acidoterrestris]|nr:hypothetical protein AAC03nite_38500 [Alicyclobacillus acidoterrestris]
MKAHASFVDIASALREIKGDFESEGVAIKFVLGMLSQMLQNKQNYWSKINEITWLN